MNDRVRKIFDIIHSSPKKVNVLPYDAAVGQRIRDTYQLHPESVLGILLDRTGGIVIDDWIRIYGAGELDLLARNAWYPFEELVVAEDVTGGLFLYLRNGNIGYFAPDSLQIEDVGIQYGRFLSWCLHGDTALYYADTRWNGWQADAAGLVLSDGIAFYPFLWTKADSLESRKRSVVPMQEIIGLEMDWFRQSQ